MKRRYIGKEIPEGVRAIKEGKGRRFKVELPSDVKKIREHLHLSQSAFAALMGVSINLFRNGSKDGVNLPDLHQHFCE